MKKKIAFGIFLMKNKNLDSHKTPNRNMLKTALYADIATFHFSSSNKGSYVNSSYVIPWVFEGLMRRGKHDIPEFAMAEKMEY